MKDEKIKTLIVLAFVALIIYWGVTGFSVTGNWVALIGPIILGYLFKPPSNGSNGTKKTKSKNENREHRKPPPKSMDRDPLHRSSINFCYPLFSI